MKAIQFAQKSKNSWPLVIDKDGRRIDVHLVYWPIKKLMEMLKAADLAVLSKRGTNMLSCFLPEVVRSQVYARPGPLGKFSRLFYRWVGKVDSWLCRKLYLPAGIHFFVVGRPVSK